MNANPLIRTCTHPKLVQACKVNNGEYRKAESKYDKPRKPNPIGRPRYLASPVSRKGFIINLMRMKQKIAETSSIVIRSKTNGGIFLRYPFFLTYFLRFDRLKIFL